MPAAAAVATRAEQRQEQRQERVAGGLQELDRWLTDQVRTGLAGLPRLGYAHFDAIAARMVDAQAPGVAGVLRGIPAEFAERDWPDRVLHQLAGLHLLSRAHERLDALPVELAATVRSRIGYPTAKAEVLARPGVEDSWWAVGAVDATDQQLRRRRVWVRGVHTGLIGVWLTFAPPGMSFDETLLPGIGVRTTLHRYPGAGQSRVLLGEPSAGPVEPLCWTGDTIEQTRRRFAAEVAADPWSSRLATAIEAVPVRGDDGWWLRDATGEMCPMLELAGQPWPLLAQSGGDPITVFGEWNGSGLVPLSVVPDGRGRSFSTGICG